jgi:hypothetical protein
MEAPSGDRHSFTINAPYKVDIDILLVMLFPSCNHTDLIIIVSRIKLDYVRIWKRLS